MIKLIGFDLDDTLLNSNKDIDDLDLLTDLHNKGMKYCLCSGRPLVKRQIDYYRALGVTSNAYYVGYNGATIYKLNGEVVYENHLSIDEVKSISTYIKNIIDKHFSDSNLAICLHTNDCLYATKDNWAVDYDYQLNDIKLQITDFYNEDLKGPKIMIDGDTDIIAKLFDMIHDHFISSYNIFISMPCYIEILKKDVNKFVGLDYVRKMYGLEQSEVMAFGDAGNDVEMIRDAYIGVCMANGRSEAKEVADYITSDNDHHGIVKALKHFDIL